MSDGFGGDSGSNSTHGSYDPGGWPDGSYSGAFGGGGCFARGIGCLIALIVIAVFALFVVRW